MIDAWIYAIPAEWDAIDPDGLSKAAARAYTGAITGFWDSFAGGYEVYNVLASRETLAELNAVLPDVHATFMWRQGPGFDEFNEDGTFNTEPDDILAVMKDHITYDQSGNPTGSTPATFANANWGHVFFGQGTRIFAGKFSNKYSEAFR